MKVLKIISVIIGILMIAAGLYCVFNPGITYLSIGYAVGVAMILDAAGRFHAWWQLRKTADADGWMLVGAVLSLIFGIVLVSNSAAQLSVDVFVAYMAASWILVNAIITVIRSFRARRLHKKLHTRVIGKHWWVSLILGILLCVFAVLSLINPTIVMASIGVFIGLGIIVAGANMIAVAVTQQES